MSRKIKCIIITILLALILLGSIVAVVSAYQTISYNVGASKYIYGYDTTYNLDEVQEVYLGNSNEASNINEYSIRAENFVLNQPNIYCVQRNVAIHNGGRYSVSNEYTVESQLLAYILYNGPTSKESDDNSEDAYQSSSAGSQIALWEYLADYRYTNDVATMLGNIEASNTQWSFNNSTSAQSLYSDAETWANSINNFNPSIEVTQTSDGSNKVNIRVKGLIANSNFTLKLNNEQILNSETKANGNGEWVKNDYAVDTSGENIFTATVENPTQYVVKYRILKSASNQRLIVVTDKSERNSTNDISTTIYVTPALSLQKFILKKNTTNYSDTVANLDKDNIVFSKGTPTVTEDTDTSVLTYMTKRHHKMATESTADEYLYGTTKVREIAKDQVNKKVYNPVNIKNGDYITYQISLYKNGTNSTGINITDYLRRIKIQDDGSVKDTGVISLSDGDGTNAKLMNITAFSSASTSFSSPSDYSDYNTEINNNNLKIKGINFNDNIAAIKFLVTIQFNNISSSEMIIANYAYINSYSSTTYRTMDADYVIIKKPELGLQKYISEVNGKSVQSIYNGTDGATKDTDIIDFYNKEQPKTVMLNRGSKRASADTNKFKMSDTVEVNDDYMSEEYYKINNPVSIEKGDTVTYRIRVYNNDIVTANDIKVYDYLSIIGKDNKNSLYIDPEYYKVTSVAIQTVGEKLKIENVAGVTSTENAEGWAFNIPNDETPMMEFNIKELKQGEVATITLKIQINLEVENDKVIRNYAYIGAGQRNGTYRIFDADFVSTKKHSISLEKFVSQVSDINGNVQDIVPDIDRTNKRYNDHAEDKTNDENYYDRTDSKVDNKVQVEPGDKVTYTIRLQNTGAHPIKAIEFYDIFEYVENSKYLEYESIALSTTSMANKKTTGSISEPTEYNVDTGRSGKLITYTCEDDLLLTDEYVDIEITFKVNIEKELTNEVQTLNNRAAINYIYNKNDLVVYDFDETDNNRDNDYIQTKTYAVSLEKYVSQVNKNAISPTRSGKAEHEYDNVIDTNNQLKYTYPATVSNGDKVTYTIKVKNNGNTSVTITNIADYLPNGIKCNDVSYTGEIYSTEFGADNGKTENKIDFTTDIVLNAGEEEEIYLEVEVIEPNISLKVLRNIAEITSMTNRNNVSVLDTTLNDNRDSDYIQMRDITISGFVWNDLAQDKAQSYYNGVYDDGNDTVNNLREENKLSGIKVYLYRFEKNTGPIKIQEVTTNSEGKYTFNTKYIKGPKVEISYPEKRWAGTYYSYYVVFEYDGITYTSTTFAEVTSENEKDSNAREKLNSNEEFDGQVAKDRTTFNNQFNTINNESGIEYTTDNKEGYIPQSIHEYNSSTMAMQSSTKLITLSADTTLEQKLQHVNLGLRGRDIFDLEITSDVDTAKVTVNGKQGVYRYTNKVTLRRNDLSANYTYAEDMANTYLQGSEYVGENQNQYIRESDFDLSKAEAGNKDGTVAYSDNQGVSNIEVIYKITVRNVSKTAGTATKITNYYDSDYHINTDKGKVAYYYDADGNQKWISSDNIQEGDSDTGFNSIDITTPGTILNQGDSMDVYVVYTLNTPIKTTLKGLTVNKSIPTYNMAEITEYTTQCAEGQTEFTRGLIDKDSAPGSANTETVRLTTGTSNDTTVQYYFKAKDLKYLKYEDDTYATPTLYFVVESANPENPQDTDYSRIITGKVFRDETVTDSETKIKTGNGILDDGEVGVYGATVQLIEQVGDGVVRDIITTGTDGSFTFRNFLPGNYIIRYYYGDTIKTVLLKQSDDESVNTYSFNGEDYQSTNNSNELTVKDNTGRELTSNVLSTAENFWYLYNEADGISTAKDNVARRNEITEYVIEQGNNIITLLNKVKAGEEISGEDKDKLINNTHMYSDTQPMLFTVEKTELEDEELKPRETFGEYQITNMNFGIAEVPVTKINLQKTVDGFTLMDSTGKNVIAKMYYDTDKKEWLVEGNVLTDDNHTFIDLSVEDEKLQGARLEITYAIRANTVVQRNYDKTGDNTVATITGLVDIINNNLSYNANLKNPNGELNSKYWSIMSKPLTTSSIPNIEDYKVVVEATNDTKELVNDGNVAYITLEKVLSSTDATLDEIMKSTVDIYEYNNTVEIIGLDYSNVTPEDTDPNDGIEPVIQKDRIRKYENDTKNGYIIVAGQENDATTSATLSSHTPTGDNGIATIYYVIAAISLLVIVIGVFGIKKFVVNNKK